MTWKLKIRIQWIKEGDANTRSFHNAANGRRNRNSIWHINATDGSMVHSLEDIQDEAYNYFETFYRVSGEIDCTNQAWMLTQMPTLMDRGTNELLGEKISSEEIVVVLKSFAQDKSPRPDGWPTEFFMHFYEILAEDMLAMTE